MTEQSLANLYSIKSDKDHTHDGSEITSAVSTANKLASAITISLIGDVTGSAAFDGSSDISITTAASSSSGGSLSAGDIIYRAQNSVPAGFLKANGAAVSRTTYAALFAAIGTTYGAGDGSTTFTLPDLRGVFPRGFDDGRGYDTGRVFGSYQADDNKAHTHGGGSTYQTLIGQDSGSTPVATTTTTGSSGGTEARPKNIALLACIKY